MISDFKVSAKTKHPACCHWGCCGNKFGRIEKRSSGRHKDNRMVKTRRYAKHVEKQKVMKEIREELE